MREDTGKLILRLTVGVLMLFFTAPAVALIGPGATQSTGGSR